MTATTDLVSQVMQTSRADPVQAILQAYGFGGWASRQGGRRLRCPHGLLIAPNEECPVGCISPLVVMGAVEPAGDPASGDPPD